MTTDQPGQLSPRTRTEEASIFENAFKTYREPLHRYITSMLCSEADAKDLVQDLFTDLWERRDTLCINTSIHHYLFSAARKMILRKLRDDGVKARHLDRLIRCKEQGIDMTMRLILHKDIIGRLQAALHHLPEKERQVFILSHFDELSIREIALKTGTAEQTVRNQLNSAGRKAKGMISRLLTIVL